MTTTTQKRPHDVSSASDAGVNSPAREWLTAAQAAEYAGDISVSTIRDGANRNRLRHVRIGGGMTGPIRTRREWIDQWLTQWVRGGDAAPDSDRNRRAFS